VKEKVLSICTAAYNIENYAVRLLDSISASERIENIEVIIVDDGSTDNTGKVVEKYVELYPDSIRYVRKENGGSGSARNVAFKLAKGKYLKLVDGDDYVNSLGMQHLIDYLSNNDLDMVINDYMTISGNKTDVYNYSKYLTAYTIQHIGSLDIRSRFSMHAFTFKTELIQKNQIKLSEGKSYVDQEYMSFILPYVHIWTYLPETVYIYQLGLPTQSCNDENKIKKLDHMYYIVKSLADNYCSVIGTLELDNSTKNILLKMLSSFYYTAAKVTMLSDREDLSELINLDTNVIRKNAEIDRAAGNNKLIKSLRNNNFKNYKAVRFVVRSKHNVYKFLRKYHLVKG